MSNLNPTSQPSQDKQVETSLQVSTPHQLDPIAIGWQVEGIAPWRRELSSRIVRAVTDSLRFGVNHFFAALNTLNGLFFALAFGAPLIAWLGVGWFYQKVFQACHLLCVQNHDHSFSLFGYQMPFCERCLALYGSMFVGGIAFRLGQLNPRLPIVGLKFKRLPFWGVFLTSLPIAVDGFSQMFGWRQSNWELRLLTGAIFGTGVIWYLYPQIADKLRAAQRIIASDHA